MHVRQILPFAAVLAFASVAHAAAITTGLPSYGFALAARGTGGTSWNVIAGADPVRVERFSGNNVIAESRYVQQFRRDDVPTSATVQSATFSFNVTGYESIPPGATTLRLYAYGGDLALDAADVVRTQAAVALDVPVALGTNTFTLDAAVLTQVLAAPNAVLGFVVTAGTDDTEVTLRTTAQGNRPAPEVAITYVVPEPATLAAIVGLGAIATRRRR